MFFPTKMTSFLSITLLHLIPYAQSLPSQILSSDLTPTTELSNVTGLVGVVRWGPQCFERGAAVETVDFGACREVIDELTRLAPPSQIWFLNPVTTSRRLNLLKCPFTITRPGCRYVINYRVYSIVRTRNVRLSQSALLEQANWIATHCTVHQGERPPTWTTPWGGHGGWFRDNVLTGNREWEIIARLVSDHDPPDV